MPCLQRTSQHKLWQQSPISCPTISQGPSCPPDLKLSTNGAPIEHSPQKAPHLEALDALLELHVLPWGAGEDLSHEEGLAQEPLDLTGACHHQLVVFTELVHTQDGNDILQILVVLEHLLHPTGHVVVLLANDAGGQHARGGIKRVHGRVDTQLGDLQV